MQKRILLSLLLVRFSLEAVQVPDDNYTPVPKIEAPWFTGPLLAPSGRTIPPGQYNIEPYVYSTANTGRYNSHWKRVDRNTFWANIFQPSIQIGLNQWLDFQFNPTMAYNYTHGAAKWVLADMPIGFDFQLFKTDRPIDKWNMGVELALKETIPLGKYQNLSANKLSTDGGGQGSWQTAVGLVWGNMFYLGGDIYFLSWRTALQYALPAPVSVKNLNVYGGAQGTRGTVYPSQTLELDTAIEINLSRHWAFAMDVLGVWNSNTRFKGTATASMTSPSSLQFSLAPALEYNWNDDFGIIFGCWFTVAGKNSSQFTSGVIALNYYK